MNSAVCISILVVNSYGARILTVVFSFCFWPHHSVCTYVEKGGCDGVRAGTEKKILDHVSHAEKPHTGLHIMLFIQFSIRL